MPARHRPTAPSHRSLSSTSTTLPPSTIRVQPTLLTYSTNNLTYARLGEVLHWWDTYPVPTPTPDLSALAETHIVPPSWGYATVLSSNIASIQAEQLVWGFWASTDAHIDLKLKPAEDKGVEGHWLEISPHRGELMNVYNRYIVEGPRSQQGGDGAKLRQVTVLKPLFEAAYLLSAHVFPSEEGDAPIHPLGFPIPWTTSQADLKDAVVVLLGASSKTGRKVAWTLLQERSDKAGPQGVVLAASSKATIDSLADTFGREEGAQIVDYDSLPGSDVLKWMSEKGSKVVIMDCGSPATAGPGLIKALKTGDGSKQKEVMVVVIGNDVNIYKDSGVDVVQYNTSGARDAVMAAIGEKEHFDRLEASFGRYMQSKDAESYEIIARKGVDGIAKTWDDLVAGRLKSNDAVVVELP